MPPDPPPSCSAFGAQYIIRVCTPSKSHDTLQPPADCPLAAKLLSSGKTDEGRGRGGKEEV